MYTLGLALSGGGSKGLAHAGVIKFLNENNRREFSIAYTIPEGSPSMPSVVDTLKVREGNDIRNVRRSIQMVMELEILGDGQDLDGSLDFSSKGLFRFEF